MIHKFLTALEKYGHTMFYQKHSEAEQALQDGYNKILLDIEEYQLSQPDSLKQYVIGLYDSIIEYRQRNLYQRNELEIKFNEDKSKLTNLEATEHDLKVDYLKTIYNYILDAEFYLVEYLTETGNTRNMFQSHYQLYNALIFASNESEEQPISGAVEIIRKVWFFVNSDNATFNGKRIGRVDRPIFVNPVLIGKANFDQFFKSDVWFDSKMHNIKLTEHDFINDITDWVELQINSNTKHSATRLRKYNEFLDYFGNNADTFHLSIERKEIEQTPITFEELFYNPNDAEICLEILSELFPPSIDAANNYIGNNKGIFPLWIRVLKENKPKPLIRHYKDIIYKNLLNSKIHGLNLSKDASEFRKQYSRLEKDRVELNIKTILSQISQSGRLGK